MAVEFPASEHENAARAVIEQAGAALAARRSDIPADFRRAALRPRGGGGCAVLRGRRSRRTGRAGVRFSQRPAAGRAENPLRDRGAERVGRAQVGHGDRDRQRRHAVPGQLGDGRDRRAPAQCAAGGASGVRRAARRRKTCRARRAPMPPAARARASSISISSRSRTRPRAPTSCARSRACSAKCGWRCRTGAPCCERVNGIVADLKTNPPPLPVDEIAEAIQFLQWLLADNFTFLGVRNYTFDGNTLEPDFDSALGIMRSRELRVLKHGNELLEFTPEIMAFLKEPRLLIIAKANIHARVHRRVYLDYVGIKRFDASGNLVGEQRIVGLFTSTAYTRAAHSIPYLRRKIAGVEARAGFDAEQSFRQSAGQRAGALSARRTVPDRRRLALSFRARHPAARRTAARARAGAARPLRPLRVGAGVRAARTLRQRTSARGSAIISASAFIGRVSAFYPFFPEGPLVRVHFIIGRSGGHAPAIDSATLEREVAAIVRSWTDGLSDALALVNPPDKARALFARYRDAFSVGFQEAYAPAVAAGDIRVVESLERAAPARRRFPSPAGGGAARGRPQSLEPGSARCRCRNAFRCWKTWASGWWTSAPTTSRPDGRRRRTTPGSTTCCWSAATAA